MHRFVSTTVVNPCVAMEPTSGKPLKPAPFTELSNEDAILNFIFDPHRTFIGATLPSERSEAASGAAKSTDPTPEEAKHARIQALERTAVQTAEAGDLDTALQSLDAIISSGDALPSTYNNRAQVHRLQKNDDAAKVDLDLAISLAHAYLDLPEDKKTDSLIAANRSVLKQAYTQRAIYHQYVHRACFDLFYRITVELLICLCSSAGNASGEASDMAAAATYGSTLARMMTTGVRYIDYNYITILRPLFTVHMRR